MTGELGSILSCSQRHTSKEVLVEVVTGGGGVGLVDGGVGYVHLEDEGGVIGSNFGCSEPPEGRDNRAIEQDP